MEHACMASLGSENTQNLIALCKSGLSAKIFDEVANCLQVPDIRLANIINIKKSTLIRRKREGRLSFEESQRLYRIVRLLNMAENLFGSSEHARQWLNAPSRDFEGKSPLEYADNEIGAREVEAVLDRIGDGVIF
jgi:putative toxin-antitoxin system antitoxin component (TIGR02293 family)